jgi:BlaI family transcriptional regulator, penicillinase repressor
MAPDSTSPGGVRHSILDLAPLELDCMNALWPSGEATVRQIQEALRPTRPRAYTTIMTILDRLAQKGIVQRRKAGRAWVYRANVSADEARTHAVSQVVDGFFGGSAGALATHLIGHPAGDPEIRATRLAPAAHEAASPSVRAELRRVARHSQVESEPSPESPAHANLDPVLL